MLRIARADADADQLALPLTSRRRDLGRRRPVGVQVGRVDEPLRRGPPAARVHAVARRASRVE